METSEIYSIRLNKEQKEWFDKWLIEAEKELELKLQNLKSLRSQTEIGSEVVPVQRKQQSKTPARNSMTSKLIEVMQDLKAPQTSAQLIDWFAINDETFKGKDKRFITKAITSKLSFLVDKGRITKEVVDGRNMYELKN